VNAARRDGLTKRVMTDGGNPADTNPPTPKTPCRPDPRAEDATTRRDVYVLKPSISYARVNRRTIVLDERANKV
jgi:hypothetical protein